MKENSENKIIQDKQALEEVSIYFDDILRNKDMIKEMLKTNILVYEDKIKSNKEKLAQLKGELEKIVSEFIIVENKLKLNYAKSHDQFQKHDINYKLLDKTHTHYKMLVKEREDEIKKIEEQTIFAYQDYQNKKIKLDCINVQIIEAEFQLKNLQKKVDEQINNVIDNDESICNKSCVTDITDKRKTKDKIENIEQFLTEKMPYKSQYNKSSSLITNKNTDNFYNTMSLNDDKLRRTKCLIY